MTVMIGIKKLNFPTRISFEVLLDMETEQERAERLERLWLEKEKIQQEYKDLCTHTQHGNRSIRAVEDRKGEERAGV